MFTGLFSFFSATSRREPTVSRDDLPPTPKQRYAVVWTDKIAHHREVRELELNTYLRISEPNQLLYFDASRKEVHEIVLTESDLATFDRCYPKNGNNTIDVCKDSQSDLKDTLLRNLIFKTRDREQIKAITHYTPPELEKNPLFFYAKCRTQDLHAIERVCRSNPEYVTQTEFDSFGDGSYGSFRNNPLTWAIGNENHRVAMILLDPLYVQNSELMKQQINHVDNQGKTPLIFCIKQGWNYMGLTGDIERISNAILIERLISLGANVDIKDYDGNTAVHYAFLRRDLDAIRALVQAGASMSMTNKLNETPIDMLTHSWEVACQKLNLDLEDHMMVLTADHWNEKEQDFKQAIESLVSGPPAKMPMP